MDKYVVTISRQFASMGRTIAQMMSENLEINFYDRDIVEATAKRMGQPISLISNEEESRSISLFRRQYPLGMEVANIQDEIFQVQSNIIQDLASKESCILVGRCADYVLKEHKRSLNIYVYAPFDKRVENCTQFLGMDIKQAQKMIKSVDKAREQYRYRYCKDVKSMYDGHNIMIDSSRFGLEGTATILSDIVKKEFS